ncbi:hypothetical protein EBB07_31100 [Paenibacillaceae bacterium]|nr:hypothetical protein EBB07_31100 [Paenibacillaceae bacterium]
MGEKTITGQYLNFDARIEADAPRFNKENLENLLYKEKNYMVHSHRIRLLDVLRGFAIIGTLGTNIWIFAETGYTDLVAKSWSENIGSTLALLQEVFINGKFLGLFYQHEK